MPTPPSHSSRPDVGGAYSLQLIVSNGTLQSTPVNDADHCRHRSLRPNARAGYDRNAMVGQGVTLDGSASYDPQHPAARAHLHLDLQSVPNGSALTNAQITGLHHHQPPFHARRGRRLRDEAARRETAPDSTTTPPSCMPSRAILSACSAMSRPMPRRTGSVRAPRQSGDPDRRRFRPTRMAVRSP